MKKSFGHPSKDNLHRCMKSHRACFQSRGPHFFIQWLTEFDDTVYDPFNGRGTTIIEAGLLGRKVIANDINPLSEVLSRPRLSIPNLEDLQKRLSDIRINPEGKGRHRFINVLSSTNRS